MVSPEMIVRSPKDDPPRIALPEKPKAKQTRRERRAEKAKKAVACSMT